MAKTKQTGSAAQRRAQERQQRQRRDEGRASALVKSKNVGRGPTIRRRKDRSRVYMIIGVLALIVIIIGVLIYISQLPATGQKATPADQSVLAQLKGVPQSTWEAIGKGSPTVNNVLKAQSGQPLLKGPNGHPEFFYVGAEYCPNCAAERWAMINALDRFGTFKNLGQIVSAETPVSTFTFEGSSYTSQYIDFVPKEILGNTTDSSGSWAPLDKLTATQQQNFTKYDNQLSFPFVNIGNQYVAVGANYYYTVLQDNGSAIQWQDIASTLTNTKSPIAQGILGTANYMTAAICSVTNQQPSTVCGSSVIQQIQQSLRPTSNTASNSSLALMPADLLAAQRRTLG